MPDESTIRDELSKSLSVLEPGLTLIEVEHKLLNPVGAKGFIDILARDRLGNFVIIELKRSDQAARQAIQEIFKYVALFQQQHGTKAHKLRCFVVSTTWHELLTPFSEFRRNCEMQATGYAIKVDAKGRVLKTEKVSDSALTKSRVFKRHSCFLFTSANARSKGVADLRQALDKLGATGYLIVSLNYEGGRPEVIYPYCAYLVPTQISDTAWNKALKGGAKELDTEDAADPERVALAAEEKLLSSVFFAQKHPVGKTKTFEIGYPEKFMQLVESDWAVKRVERLGPFASKVLLPDAEVVNLVKALDDGNLVRFERLTTPANALDWKDVGISLDKFLETNSAWRAGMKWYLNQVATFYPDAVVTFYIFDPMAFGQALFYTALKGDLSYLPALHVQVESVSKGYSGGMLGQIVWDGKTVPASTEQAFAFMKGGIDDYVFAIMVKDTAAYEDKLLKKHGMKYSLYTYQNAPDGTNTKKKVFVKRDRSHAERSVSAPAIIVVDFVMSASLYMQQFMQDMGRRTRTI